MRLPFIIAAAVLICACNPNYVPSNPQERAASELASRILPRQSRNIEFHLVEGDGNYYSMEAAKGKLCITADCTNSMAMALGDYLRNECMTTVTWYSRDAVKEPSRLPDTDGIITRKALVKDRFFLNYCTYGYTIGWWQWDQWERLIDWMAMNGVTMALANTGQESVWQNVWMKFGLTEQQTREYFTGPSFLSWHRMTNMDGWHGPLPQAWLDGQRDLQKKIIARETQLGIAPILSSFTGHVPRLLKDIYPEADIRKLSAWGNFDEEYNPWYLNPNDSLYKEIQLAYLAEQKAVYGQDTHVYGIDLFNEVNPPSWDPDYLGDVARRTYEILEESDPDAVWLQMSWLFYHKSKAWTPERVKAYITPVPKHKLIMLDYYCDKVEIYRQTENFHGQDFIWSYLGNFGGCTMIAGDLEDISMKISRVLAESDGNCRGLGCTLEALDVNPEMYEYVLDRAWEQNGSDEQWMRRLADRHLGKADEANRKAWDIMHHKVLKQIGSHVVSMIPARPNLDGTTSWNKPQKAYDNSELGKAWGLLLEAGPSNTPSYRFDCVNFGRQYLDNLFTDTYLDIIKAYKEGDKDRVSADGKRMLEILDDVERLTATDSYFLLGRWISEARSWGESDEEKAYYEWDARDLISCWGFKGGKLTDYSNRDWNGLISSYYKPRWQKFIELLVSSDYFDESTFRTWCEDFEWNWIETELNIPDTASGNAWKTSRELYNKYLG